MKGIRQSHVKEEEKKKSNICNTASEWLSAWRRATKAISFAFPHRKKNYLNMGTTSNVNSLPNLSSHTIRSSFTILCSEIKSQEANIHNSLTFTNIPDSILPSSFQTELKCTLNNLVTKNQHHLKTTDFKSVINSTLGHVKTPIPSANTDIYAKDVTKLDIPRKIVQPKLEETYRIQPKYLCHNLWKDSPSLSPTTTEWSETALPLPRLPLREFQNSIVLKTIADNPLLFQVRTPVDINVFQSLLQYHSNPIFVDSVCMGKRYLSPSFGSESLPVQALSP
jgi:hypothetical protein